MEIFRTRASLQAYLSAARQAGRSIGFVPTMGALHEGHLSLVGRARKENDCVVVSVFVNPTQFNDPKDLASYPRTEEADAALLAGAGADAVFMPTVEQVYPEPDARQFDFGAIERVMEGASRPGHFNGVAQVVSRLFEMVEPRRAYFGEKDFQQLAIIRMMTQRLGMTDIEIVGCPIVRAADGLALSSRNMLLDEQHRAAAPHIYATLSALVRRIDAGEDVQTAPLVDEAVRMMDSNPCLQTEYIQVVDPVTLQPVETVRRGQTVRLCTAVRCAPVRLIDNMEAVNR